MNTPDLPPHSTEAEAGVLACCLLDNSLLPEILTLPSEAFYELRHRIIFETLGRMHSDGVAVDPVTLVSRLKDSKQLEAVGGLEYIAPLPDRVPSSANLKFYTDELRQKFVAREGIQAADEFVSRVRDNPKSLDVYLKAASDSFADVRRFLPAAKGSLPEIVDSALFAAEPMEQPSELVCGVLHRGSKLALGGGSKSFKTWTLLDLALSVSHGEPWLNFKTTKGQVLFINLEIQPWSFQARLRAIAAAKRIQLKPGQLHVWNLRGHAADFQTLLPRITEKLTANKFALLIIDPMYKLLGDADENSARDIARLLNSVERLTLDTQAAVAFGSHFSKGNQAGKEAIDRISGSGVFARDPDSIITLTRHQQDDAFTVDTTLRNFKAVEQFVVRWLYPLMRVDTALDPSQLKQAKGGRSATYSAEILLQHLPKKGSTTGAWKSKVCEETGMSPRKFFDLLKELQTKGSIVRDSQSRWKKGASAESAK